MRTETRMKLFHNKVYREIREDELLDDGGIISFVECEGNVILVHDYSDSADGFDVYLCAPGRTVHEARAFAGIDKARATVVAFENASAAALRMAEREVDEQTVAAWNVTSEANMVAAELAKRGIAD